MKTSNCYELVCALPSAIFCSSVFPSELSGTLSQGFRLFGLVASLGGAVLRTFGISRIPGIGCPVVISSTIRAKEVGYDASTFSEAESSVGCDIVGNEVLLVTFSLLIAGFVVSMD